MKTGKFSSRISSKAVDREIILEFFKKGARNWIDLFEDYYFFSILRGPILYT